MRLSTAWFHFSRYRIRTSERRAWLEAALALGDEEDASPAGRAALLDALRAAGYAANEDDRAGTASAQRLLGLAALQRGALAEAQAWMEQSLNLCQEAHDPEGLPGSYAIWATWCSCGARGPERNHCWRRA